jgi:hypothetical protein
MDPKGSLCRQGLRPRNEEELRGMFGRVEKASWCFDIRANIGLGIQSGLRTLDVARFDT